MTRSDALGEFEHLVLLAILQLGPGTYGVPIRDEIEARAGRDVTLGAVYSTLRRLEAKGWIESWMSDPEPVPGGRSKKEVRLTSEGARTVREAHARIGRMAEGLSDVLRLP
ncbi:PadR family transcriptional regulator [Gaopeijia maritima]|uniref:Helix-turn-helix transcriptional regulator n=1 Tax=Gaopeijia maritima TaxID=3119007 RepID=A0ABU9E6R5_9BACT